MAIGWTVGLVFLAFCGGFFLAAILASGRRADEFVGDQYDAKDDGEKSYLLALSECRRRGIVDPFKKRDAA